MERLSVTSKEILANIQQVLDDVKKLHFRFYRYGIAVAGLDARRKLKELRPLIKAYLAVSIDESRRPDDDQ